MGFPDVGTLLAQADVGEDAVHEMAGHLARVGWPVVEGGDQRVDRRSGVGGQTHVANVNLVEGRLAQAEDEREPFLEADVGGALDEVGGEAIGDAGERAHAAGQDDHAGGGIAAAGDGRADVVLSVLGEFG